MEEGFGARGGPALGPFLGGAGELGDLARVAELGGEVAHGGGEDVPAVPAVTGGLGEAERLDVIALGQSWLSGVDRHVSSQLGEAGDGGEEFPADRLAVGTGEQSGDDAVEVMDDDGPHVPAAVLVVEVDEGLCHGAHGGDVGLADALARPGG